MDRRNQTPYWRNDEGDEAGAQRFQERHQSFSDKVERFLMQLVILGLVGLVLVQSLSVVPAVRRWTNLVEALEGVPWNQVLAWRGDGGDEPGAPAWQTASSGPAVAPVAGTSRSLTLTVDLVSHRSAPDARLLIDGQSAGTFADGRVSTVVKPGQVVVIDGGAQEEARIFRVIEAGGLSSPPLGSQVTTRGDQQRLGVVRPAE